MVIRVKLSRSVCEAIAAGKLTSLILVATRQNEQALLLQWSLHPLRFPRYRGTETLLQEFV